MAHLLSSILLAPLAGALVIGFTPKQSVRLIRHTAMATTFLVLTLVGLSLFQFRAEESGFQLVEKILWIPQFNVAYLLGVDGISMPMIFLTALISLLACAASSCIDERQKQYYVLFLLLETGMLGTFLALDLFLFYVFWEAVLVPMYFLIGIWGGERREYAALKFFLYTLAGSLFMLLGILAVYFASTPHTFSLLELNASGWSAAFQRTVFLAFFLGFAVKVPVWPFHTWLPDAHVEAPTPISVILAAVLLKMGTYGFLRFNYSLFPEAALWFQPAMILLGVIGIVYGGFVALAQTDFKKMVAYSSVSHMGFVLLGLGALNADGFRGAMLQMFNHGIITGGLFLLVGMLYARTHTRDMTAFGGLAAKMPVYAGWVIFFSMASLGLPGLSGFAGEFLILLGSFQHDKISTAVSCAGILLAAAYLLLMIQRIFHGPLNANWQKIGDITRSEIWVLVPLGVFIVLAGIYPNVLLRYMIPALGKALVQIGGTAA